MVGKQHANNFLKVTGDRVCAALIFLFLHQYMSYFELRYQVLNNKSTCCIMLKNSTIHVCISFNDNKPQSHTVSYKSRRRCSIERKKKNKNRNKKQHTTTTTM